MDSQQQRDYRYPASILAEAVGAEIIGSGAVMLTGIRPLDQAEAEHLSFFAPTTRRQTTELMRQLESSRAGAVVLAKPIDSLQAVQLVVKSPLEAVLKLAGFFYRPALPKPGVHAQASVDETAQLGQGVRIGAFAVIGEGVAVGDRSVIHPHVVVYRGVQIGSDCIVHAGAVIREEVVLGDDCVIQNGVVVGGDGFGYAPHPEGGHFRIPHLGRVVLGDHVDIGANSTIDRATFGETSVGDQTKIDNLVMIAHNVQVGKAGLLCAQVGISGSCRVGDRVVLAGQVGVADHVTIGDRVRAAAKAGINNDVVAGIDIGGNPYQAAADYRRTVAACKRLPQVMQEVRRLSRVVFGDSLGASERVPASGPGEPTESE